MRTAFTRTKRMLPVLLAVGCFAAASARNPVTLRVEGAPPGLPIQPTMYGIFLEDINFGADGGLYAERIKNRSFEFEHPFVGWLPFGDVRIRADRPCFDRNPHYARLHQQGRVLTGTGLENEGFRGIGFEAGEEYRFSMYARNVGQAPARFRLELVARGDTVASARVTVTGKDWHKVSAVLKPRTTEARGQFRLLLLGDGTADVDHVSLFPARTWKGRENGMREDLAQALADLHPGVFRFPGGCIVEGTTLDTRYQWKNSVGPVENRPININRWNYTHNRKAYDYYQSYGLGFYEYFLLSEDIGAEPLPVVSCGMACQFENRNDESAHVPVEELDPYIQDAIDLVEFANGDVATRWGKLRAEMGHPAPFGLKFIAVGNEQWSEMYPARLERFVKALREKCPEIRIVGSAGPRASGADFDYLWPEMKRLGVDLVDEHYYMPPQFFYDNAARYDRYDRQGPKVFAGEYAAHHPTRANNFDTALSEAAFMTGLERNADVVHMATYAPLFAHVDAWQWRPDLIWFDNLSVVRTPNYYVQQMYGRNAGTHALPLTLDGKPLTGQQRLYGTAARDGRTGELILKIVNADNRDRRIEVKLDGVRAEAEATATMLASENLGAENTLTAPDAVRPVAFAVPVQETGLVFDAKAQSFSVIRIPVNRSRP